MQDASRIGRYEVIKHLASGGMGQVYLGRTTGLGGFERHVVIKTLDLELADDDPFVTMFLDEARLVGALHHQYIAPVYEVGRDDAGRYFLVMEYVHGETAHAVFERSTERQDKVPLGFALTVGSAVASALHYAHSARGSSGAPLAIVHRDVTLSNLMLGYDGGVKLIDFGIAKAANRATTTQVGALKGKVAYLAPEQILGRPVDHRADIFALGVVLYELTTMRRAFRAGSDFMTMERITTGRITPPSQVIRDYPRGLELIVMKALATDPEARFQDAATLGRELDAFGHRNGLVLGHPAVAQVMELLFDHRSEPWLSPAPRHARADLVIEMVPEAVPVETDEAVTMPVDIDAMVIDEEPAYIRIESLPARRADPTPVRAASPLAGGGLAELGSDERAALSAFSVGMAVPHEVPMSPSGRSAVGTQPPIALDDDDMLDDGRLPPAGGASQGWHDDIDDALMRFAAPRAGTDLAIPIEPTVRAESELAIEIFREPIEVSRVTPQSFTAIVPRPAPPRPRLTWLLICGALALAAALLIGGLAYSNPDSSSPPPAVATPKPAHAGSGLALLPAVAAPPPVTAPQAAPPTPVLPTTIAVHVTTTPGDATVLLDGKRLGHTPYDGAVPAEPGKHVLKLRRRGYAPQKLDVELTADLTRDVPLHAVGSGDI